MNHDAVSRQVRAFYDSIGWQTVGEGLYQNARYEDLRPVAREYLHRCHLRVGRVLPSRGEALLDAGSGPIQYPEYLEYSQGFRRRVCLDLSHRALQEARRRLGAHGRYVVADATAVPFGDEAFDGVVSLHMLHHIAPESQEVALREMTRVLRAGGSAAVVYSWGARSGLMRWTLPLVRLAESLLRARRSRRMAGEGEAAEGSSPLHAPGSFTFKHDQAWMRRVLAGFAEAEIRVWRSLDTRFLRALIHGPLLGRALLRLVYALEELAPRWFGRHGAYPLIVLRRRTPAGPDGSGPR
jgi:SAM-dependent methyltransferase